MTSLQCLQTLSLLLDAFRVFLICVLVCLVGECVIRAIEMVRDVLDEVRREPEFDSVGDYE